MTSGAKDENDNGPFTFTANNSLSVFIIECGRYEDLQLTLPFN